MNVLLPEIYYDPHRKQAAPAFNAEVEKKINSSVKELVGNSFGNQEIADKIFAELGDDFNLNRSMIQYNATANTQIPNDRKAYQEWLYGNMPSGKEGDPGALEKKSGGAFNYTMY